MTSNKINDTRLRIYLNDHLAVVSGEIEMTGRSLSHNQGTPLADFLDRLRADVASQQSILKKVLARIGGTENVVKRGMAWFAEKLGRFKLNDSILSYSELSRVVELEMLTVAAQERVSLWDTLEAITEGDQRLEVFSFSAFREESRQHQEELLKRRRYAALQAFSMQRV